MLVSAVTLANAAYATLGFPIDLADSNYYLVRADWLNGPFAGAYWDFLKLYDLTEYLAEANDCDKFDHWAAAVARALNSRSVRAESLPPGGLAFGCFRYSPDWANGGAHSINWFAHGCPVDDTHPEGIALGYYEPQKRVVVTLTDKELSTCFKCAA